VSAGLFAVEACDKGVVSLRIATREDPYLGPVWADGLSAVLRDLTERQSVRAVILEGTDAYFSAGASRESLLHAGRDMASDYASRVVRALLDVPVPTVAAAAGHAIGGGLLLALWCDAVVLAEESLYGANFMRLGFTPGMGSTRLVPEAFGPTLGREMLFSGRLLTGREIREAHCPLSHAVCARSRVAERSRALARDFADATHESLVLLKQMLANGRRESFEHGLRAEQAAHARLFEDPATVAEIERRYPADPVSGED
jgi:4-carboxy-3-alkylbut-2-enoyl-[acp] decarboxylase